MASTKDAQSKEPAADQSKAAGSVPSLDPAEDPADVEEKRPAWWELPRTVDKSFLRGDIRAPLFGFRLQGGAVSDQGVRIGFLADFLDAFRKLFAPLQVIPTGHIPEGNRLPVTSALPPNVAALESGHSVIIYFSIDPEERQLVMEERGAPATTLLTFRAVGHLGALLRMEPTDGDLVEAVEPFGRRVGRSFGNLAELLAEAKVEADWWSDVNRGGEVELPVPRAHDIADELLHKEIAKRHQETVGGFMWEAATASKRRYVRIQVGSRSIKATYDIPLTTRVTEALSRLVRVKLRETTYRYPFAETPHRREWELLEILEVGEAAGALRDAAQQRMGIAD